MTSLWHDLRSSFVGGSELSALFDDVAEDCPYSSRWQLWAAKRGMLPRKRETDPMKWGNRHESSIIRAVAEDWGLAVQPWATVTRDQFEPAPFVDAFPTERGFVLRHECGVGGTPDGLVEVDGKPWILECKTASDRVWDAWGGSLPAGYRLQGQDYCGLIEGVEGTLYAVLVGGNHLERIQIPADPRVFAGICAEVARFWTEVRDGIEPRIKGCDYESVQDWYSLLGTPVADKKARPVPVDTAESQEWLQRFAAAEARVKDLESAEEELKRLKAEGMRLFGEHRKWSVGGRSFTRVDVAPRDERVVVEKAREGYAYILAGKVRE